MATTSKADEIVRAARVRLTHPQSGIPLSAALWAMELRPDERCPTMGVSQDWTCYYNPTLVATWPVEAIATVLVHEVWHLLRRHHHRAKQLGIMAGGNERWNVAADEEINDGMTATNMPFPPGITPIVPSLFGHPDGLLAEEYYARLPQAPKGSCGIGGSGADGIQRPWEQGGNGTDAQGNAISKRPIPEELIARAVAEEISKHPGNVPGNWKRWAGERLTPKLIPWQTILKSVVGRIITAGQKQDYSYSRPTRRQALDSSLVMPGMIGTLPEVCVLVDTSGSMSDDNLAESLTIVESVLEHLGRQYPLTVVAGDTIPQSTQKVLQSRKIDLQGGGGTDMGALIAHACALKPRPQIIVTVTDGYTPWPEYAPVGIQTVVVLVGDGTSPTWATTVRTK